MLLDTFNRTRSFSLIALLILLSFATGASARSSRPDHHTVRFASFPLAVPVSVLTQTIAHDRILEQNLRKHGMQIVFIPFAHGNDAMEQIRNHGVDAVAFGDMPTIEAVVTGKMRIVGLAKHGHATIIGPKGSTIRDLRKKRIGNATASTGHYALLQALNSAGISESEVTIVPMNLNEMQNALVSGRIDAFSAWEPVPTLTLKAHPHSYGMLHRQVSRVYFLQSEQLLETNPEAANQISAAVVRAIRWLKKSRANLHQASEWTRSGMSSYTGRQTEVTVDEIARITTAEMLEVSGIPQLPMNESSKDSLLSKEFEFMKKLNKLTHNSTWNQVNQSIHREQLAAILKNPVRYEINRFDYAP